MAKIYERLIIDMIAMDEDVIRTSLCEAGGEQGVDAEMTWWENG